MASQDIIRTVKEKYGISTIKAYLEKLKGLKVLVVGDTILDQYTFVDPKGRAIKDPILSVEFINEETYAGGILAIANHISDFVNSITVVTLLGDTNPYAELITSSLKKNVTLKAFTKENAPTIVKKRYIDAYRKNKLFKIEYINDRPISPGVTKEVSGYLEKELGKYDLVLVGDFGHGFINNAIRDVLQKKARFLSINVQTNSANMGYNYINHYTHVDFITMNESELRMPLMKRFEETKEVIRLFYEKFGYPYFLVTIGKKGSLLFHNGKIVECPILITTVVDTVGAGDALFSVASLFAYIKADELLVSFMANAAGGIKSNYMGNKEYIEREKLLSFVSDILK